MFDNGVNQLRLAPQTGLPGKEMHLPVIWTSYQFPVRLHSCKLRLSPVQGEDMSDLAALDQNNWYASVSLVIQLAFLIASVWFARNLLRAMRAFQEQVGAMLKLSITAVTAERLSSSASAKQSVAEVSSYWLVPSKTETTGLPEPIESSPNRFTVVRRKMLLWLQAPMSSAGMAPWRRIITWLQAPAGS